jgi:hypothetical protein
MKNYYEILELTELSTLIDIKKAFRLKAIKYHPDKHFGDNYLTEKFIEVKEAYDTLSDQTKKNDYDIEYRAFFARDLFQNQEKVNEEKQKQNDDDDRYFRDPYKPFYSFRDRALNETPQYYPKINHWGEPIVDNDIFFTLPTNIGKIISGFTTLTKDFKPPTGFFASFDKIKHTCSFMGVNGFAIYTVSENLDKVITAIEINFHDITDFISFLKQTNGSNYEYDYTSGWLKNNKVVYESKLSYFDFGNGGTPNREKNIDYLSLKWAEKYWTLYLLDNMETTLENIGYIEFRLASENSSWPYVRIGNDFITFMNGKHVTYKLNEIKRIYIEKNHLNIVHNNYVKKFFGSDIGNKDFIPLSMLLNKQFFFKVLDLLLGYKFS